MDRNSTGNDYALGFSDSEVGGIYTAPIPGHTFGAVNIYGDNVRLHQGDGGNGSDRYALELEEAEKKQQRALRMALYYQHMGARKAQLAAHDTVSCDWIWTTQFPQWLSGNDPLFWIYGKPASGKSTLVNWLMGSEKVNQLLPGTQDWQLIEFYFDFREGHNVANTPVGMLRSLLYQLTKNPFMSKIAAKKYQDLETHEWIDNQKELIGTIAEIIKTCRCKLCAFIDGLDEYQGKMQDLLHCLMTLSRATGMKMVLSSRPEPMIQRYLKNVPSICTQDFNHASIQDYIRNASLMLSETELADMGEIFESVEQQANGVILWAKFIVDELVSDRIAGATNFELRHTLETYPTELVGVYSRILGKVSARHRLQVDTALSIVHKLGRPSTNCFLSMWIQNMRQSDASGENYESFSMTQLLERIHSILGGLIEIRHNSDERSSIIEQQCHLVDIKNTGYINRQPEALLGQCALFRCDVRFVHKTFSAFLKRDAAREGLYTNQFLDISEKEFRSRAEVNCIRRFTQVMNTQRLDPNLSELSSGDIQEQVLASYPTLWPLRHQLPFTIEAIINLPNAFSHALSNPVEVLTFAQSPLNQLHISLAKNRNMCCCSILTGQCFLADWAYICVLFAHNQWRAFEIALSEPRVQKSSLATQIDICHHFKCSDLWSGGLGKERLRLDNVLKSHLPNAVKELSKLPCSKKSTPYGCNSH